MSRKNSKKKEKSKHKSHSSNGYKGVLDITRSGMGYVMVDNHGQ